MTSSPRVPVLHWKAAEAGTILRLLRDAGCLVEYEETFAPQLMKQWRESPPDAFVIDPSQLPSHGRVIAVALRQSPKTRAIPLIFCNGSAEKVAAVRTLFPDAICCSSSGLIGALQGALPSTCAVKPTPMMDRYSARTTAQKLGIKDRRTIRALEPPRDYLAVLGPLPAETEWVDADADVTLCFLENADDLRSQISKLRDTAAHGKLWLLWRKKAAAGHTGVTETLVRETAIDLGLVDYKICSVNPTWSAMLFARRK